MKLISLYQINKVIQYTGFRITVGFPEDKPFEDWARGDIKLGLSWYGFRNFMSDSDEPG